ncbi:MAG: hypothetical protein HYY25_07120 [Candidatus Wallbacteria bacterium]|nr:hypothetical protein [Candidatus Wallbacteria bacterium]
MIQDSADEARREAPPLPSFTALPVILLAAMAWQRRWICDDAFIDLRVVENLLAGFGPVFNVGERVEAYTNPLWVALLTGWAAMGGPLQAGALLLGALCAVAGLAMAQRAAGSLWKSGNPEGVGRAAPGAGPLLPLGALVFASVPAAWDFCTSGLETGLTLAWLAGSFGLLVQAVSGRGALAAAAVVFGLGPLVRPDLGVFSVTFLGALCVAGPPGAVRKTALLALAGVVPAAYQVFRMGYFAALVPNTALAKEAGLANWPQGWAYLLDTAGTYHLWAPLTVLAAWAGLELSRQSRTVRLLAAVPALGAFLSALYVVRVGGDFMHGRMLLPALFAALLPVSAVPWPAAGARGRAGMAAALLAGWCLVCAVALRPASGGRFEALGVADERGFYVKMTGCENPVSAEDFAGSIRGEVAEGIRAMAGERQLRLERRALARECGGDSPMGFSFYPMRPRDPAVMMVAPLASIGLESFSNGHRVHIVDRAGLADPLASRLQLTIRKRPGHEKRLPLAWVAARFGRPHPGLDGCAAVQAARRALASGPLDELLEAIEQPLTAARFRANLALAPRFHRLRFPADPAAAARELAGR